MRKTQIKITDMSDQEVAAIFRQNIDLNAPYMKELMDRGYRFIHRQNNRELLIASSGEISIVKPKAEWKLL